MPNGPIPKPGQRRTVRFQVSVALLACALTLVSGVTGMVLGARWWVERLGEVAQVQRTAAEVEIQAEALFADLLVESARAAASGAPGAPFPEARFEDLEEDVATNLPAAARVLVPALDAFVLDARLWWNQGLKAPAATEAPPDPDADPLVGSAGDDGAARDDGAFRTMQASYSRFRHGLSALAEDRIARLSRDVGRLVPFAVAVPLSFGVFAMYAAFIMRRLISAPVEALVDAAAAITAGADQVEIPALDPGSEFGVLAGAMRRMREHLQGTIAALDDRKRRLQTIFDSMGEGALLVDGEGRVAALNRHVNPLLGLGGDRRIEIDSALGELDVGRAVLEHAGDEPIEVRLSPPGQDPARVTRVVKRPLVGPEGRPQGFVAVLHDVSQEKEAEQLKNDFLSIVTHELKTPLTGIEGYTKLVLLGRAGPLTDPQRQFLGVVHRQALTLRDMIQDLLDISRIAAGRMQFLPQPFDAAAACDKVVENSRTFAQERGLDLRSLPPPEGSDPWLSADPQRIEQVLGNLVQNACKFTGSGGRVEVRCVPGAERVLIEVEDTGRGIPEDQLPRLFQKFRQVEQADTRKVGGVGLGLYICREIVAAHGGTITVESQVGRGSTFTVALPREGGVARAAASGSFTVAVPAEVARGGEGA